MCIRDSPQVNDYVRWTTELGMVHEGWVYYKGKPDDNAKRIKDKWVATSNYITIEIATKPRPQCDLSTFLHKRIHVCLCCYENNWHDTLDALCKLTNKLIEDTNYSFAQQYPEYKNVEQINSKVFYLENFRPEK